MKTGAIYPENRLRANRFYRRVGGSSLRPFGLINLHDRRSSRISFPESAELIAAPTRPDRTQ
jgi:hypothetical protein